MERLRPVATYHVVGIGEAIVGRLGPSGVIRVWKDYRAKADTRYKRMTLDADEFIRRFLIHVLPDGFHRIRHYGLFANANRAASIALARRLLGAPDGTDKSDQPAAANSP